jgi:hypothetical protein
MQIAPRPSPMAIAAHSPVMETASRKNQNLLKISRIVHPFAVSRSALT